MRIGVVVEGEAEIRSLPDVIRKLRTPHEILPTILKATTDPHAGIGKAVRGLMIPIRTLVERRRVDLVVIAIDRENRRQCCGEIARQLQRALLEACRAQNLDVAVEVVIKDRMYENWLVADLQALRASPARFTVSQTLVNAVSPDRADSADASRLIKRAVKGPPYDKVEDAKRIMQHATPGRIGDNSRSFRRFLRVVGDPRYQDQSRRP